MEDKAVTPYFVVREMPSIRLGVYDSDGDIFYDQKNAATRAIQMAAEHRGRKVFVFKGVPVSAFRAEPVNVSSVAV